MKVINKKGLGSRRAVSRNSGDTIRNSEVMGDRVILKTTCLGKRQALVPRKEVPDILWAPGA
jgi:hypothetical protein